MADGTTHAETHDGTGPEKGSAVEDGNDAFSRAFASFAAGDTPDPQDDDHDADEGLDADAGEGGDEPSDAGEGDANAPGDPPAAGATDPDPWANASPELIAARDALVADLTTKERRTAGRVSSLQRQINDLQRERGTGEQPPANATGDEKPSDAWLAMDGKIKQLREDYPEIADVLLPLLEQQRDGLAKVSGDVAPIREANDREAVEAAQGALRAKHPDWSNYGNADDPNYAAWLKSQPANVQADNAAFKGWFAAQPPKIQAFADSWDPDESAVLLTLFKTERAEAMRKGQGGDTAPDNATDVRRQRQLEGSRNVGSRANNLATGAPDDFDGAFDHFAKKRAKS